MSDGEEVALGVVTWRTPEVSMLLAKRLHLQSRLFIDRPALSSCNILQFVETAGWELAMYILTDNVLLCHLRNPWISRPDSRRV